MKKIIVLILLVAPAFAWAGDNSKSNVYRVVADELLKNYKGVDKTIAVAGFSYSDGRDSRDGGVVAERITAELVKMKKIRVIERKEMGKVFEELKLQRSSAITPDFAKGIGKMLGADLVVIGTLSELPDKHLELSTRLVAVESAKTLSASSAQIEKNWLDQYRKMLVEENTAIEKNSKDAQAIYEQGVVYADLGEYDNAIARFGIVINTEPTHLKSYLGRGKAYCLKREYDKAIEDLSRAITIDPTDVAAYIDRGDAYRGRREYEKAIGDYSKVIAIDPKNVTAYSNRARVYSIKAEYAKAIKDLYKVMAIDPKYADAYVGYTGKGKNDKAIEGFSKARN